MASQLPEAVQLDGHATVETAHFSSSDKWILLWNGERIAAQMPEEFLQKFRTNELVVVPNTVLNLRMTIHPTDREHETSGGNADYVVDEVLATKVPLAAMRPLLLVDDGK